MRLDEVAERAAVHGVDVTARGDAQPVRRRGVHGEGGPPTPFGFPNGAGVGPIQPDGSGGAGHVRPPRRRSRHRACIEASFEPPLIAASGWVATPFACRARHGQSLRPTAVSSTKRQVTTDFVVSAGFRRRNISAVRVLLRRRRVRRRRAPRRSATPAATDLVVVTRLFCGSRCGAPVRPRNCAFVRRDGAARTKQRGRDEPRALPPGGLVPRGPQPARSASHRTRFA